MARRRGGYNGGSTVIFAGAGKRASAVRHEDMVFDHEPIEEENIFDDAKWREALRDVKRATRLEDEKDRNESRI